MDPEVTKDAALVASVLAEDGRACDRMMRKAEVLARDIARKLPQAERDSFVNEALEHLWNNDWRRLRMWKKKAPLSHYLKTMFRNLRTDHQRKRGRNDPSPSYFGPDDDVGAFEGLIPDPDIEQDAEQVTNCLQRGLDLVTPNQQQLIRLRFYEELSYQQIAESLSVHIGTVASSLVDAQKSLRRRMIGTCGELLAALFSTVGGGR
jgi:RNA polymerase sigma factor (sigma-70 family)